MRGFGAAAALEHASAHQWPPGHGSRPGGVRYRIDPARVHRARRDHPRQQRRGALWRRSGGRRDQHRDQDRRCLADQSAARHHRRLVQLPRGQCVVHRLEGALVGEHLQQRDQLQRLSRAQLLPPTQRRRRFPLYGPGRQRLPQSVGRQFVARPAGRAAGRPVDQRQPARHRPAGSDHPLRLGRQERQKRHPWLHPHDRSLGRADRRRRRAAQGRGGRVPRLHQSWKLRPGQGGRHATDHGLVHPAAQGRCGHRRGADQGARRLRLLPRRLRVRSPALPRRGADPSLRSGPELARRLLDADGHDLRQHRRRRWRSHPGLPLERPRPVRRERARRLVLLPGLRLFPQRRRATPARHEREQPSLPPRHRAPLQPVFRGVCPHGAKLPRAQCR